MLGNKPLGDGHTNWHSPEEYLLPNGVGYRKFHIYTLSKLYNMASVGMKYYIEFKKPHGDLSVQMRIVR